MTNVLRALLPQAALFEGDLEVLVVDDCSTDRSADAVPEVSHMGPLRYLRNEANLGMAQNIVDCLTKHAVGEYVWIWSQHCLLHFGALQRVMTLLARHQHLDGFYVNFQCARFPRDWPDCVDGGYAGTFDYVANSDLSSRQLDCWEHLLNVKTSLCTQTYAHILRRALAVGYWRDRPVGRNFLSGPDTFSQTATVAESMFGKPCFYIGEPVFTIFDGAQTWSSLDHRASVYLQGLPDLIRIYRRLGWSSARLREAEQYSSTKAGEVILQLLADPEIKRGSRIVRYLMKYGTHSGALGAAWLSFVNSQCCWPARFALGSSNAVRRSYQYWFFNCRPARWLRARKG